MQYSTHLIARDLAHVWHPCTQMKWHETTPPLPIERAQGLYLYDYDNKAYMDSCGSWWVCLLGHQHPRVVAALQTQLQTLSHIMLAGMTHLPVIELTERLIASAPPGLTRAFYNDNGSAAIEVALKMSFHYWQLAGNTQKTEFMILAGSYHGETLGALSVTDLPFFKAPYTALLRQPIVLPSPANRENEEALLEQAAQIFAQSAGRTCALIVEPLVQCASMRMHSPNFLRKLFELCQQHQVHLIADEIAVGFGRTGTLFACEQAKITPDFLCLSKGITGGFLPLSTVLTTDAIYHAFYDDKINKIFPHSHTYAGNPLACRAGSVVLDVLKEENTLQNNQQKIAHFDRALQIFRDHPKVNNVRQCGMIVAMTVEADRSVISALFQEAKQRGVLLRPMGNIIYFMPPYCITLEEIDQLCKTTYHALEIALSENSHAHHTPLHPI